MQFRFENKVSLKGKLWKLRETNHNYALSVYQKYGVSTLVGELLSQKNINLEDVPRFLEPKIKDHLPDPFTLMDMDKGSERIANAIINKENIAVYGDYDVDGATSSAIMTRFFKSVGIKNAIYIPDRISEGYGINTEALVSLKTGGVDLVMTLDCGILSFQPLEHAKNIGLDVVVVDHHLSTGVLPAAIAVINPNRLDDTSNLGNLCAAGLAFLTCIAVNRKLREKGFYSSNQEPQLLELLDLVALGTVCDVMTLQGLNRAYVSQGLKILSKRKNQGLNALCDIAGLKDRADVYSLGFLLGPRINAAGRIGDCSLGAKLLSENDYTSALEIADTLNNLNKERQEIEKRILEEAMNQADKISKSSPMIIVHSETWHPGIIGIVAGRIKEAFDKPTAVISVNQEIGKASARSVSGIDIGSAIANAIGEGLIVSGGGHKAAAGFTVEKKNILLLHDYLNKMIENDYAKYSNDNFTNVNLGLRVSSLTLKLANEMEKLSPFGNGNPEPSIAVDMAKIVSTKVYADKHLGFHFTDAELAKTSSISVKGISFNSINSDFGKQLQSAYMKNISLLGKLRKSYYGGNENVDFLVDDAIIY